jgi:hypothetical protein
MAKFAKKIPENTFVGFACDFLLIATMQKFNQNKPLTMTLPNSQVPNSTFGTIKNLTMRQDISFSFHNFEPTKQKLFNLKRFFSLNF